MASRTFKAVPRANLGDQATSQLRELIVIGELPPGRRLLESELCDGLGVSRTPVRQALAQLKLEGLVSADRERLIVTPLSSAEIEQLYPLIGNLERFVLDGVGGPYPSKVIEAIDALGDRFKNARTTRQRVQLDERWHELLLSPSRHKKAWALLPALKRQAQRYEFAYLRREAHLEDSYEEHASILHGLRTQRVSKAATLLEQHWRTCMDRMTTLAEEKE
jgi:DNA-binding GntR family transcriptional regulator